MRIRMRPGRAPPFGVCIQRFSALDDRQVRPGKQETTALTNAKQKLTEAKTALARLVNPPML